MAEHEEPETKVHDFCTISGASPELAKQLLEAHNWDMTAAYNSYFRDGDEDEAEKQAEGGAPVAEAADTYTGPRTLDGRPAPQESSRPVRKPAPKPKRKGVATLFNMGGSHQHDDDDDDDDDEDERDDDRGNLFAGGEKSGLAVQDPSQDGGPKKIINDILAKAKANSSRPDLESDAGPSQANRFRGAGMTLGGDGVESRSIPDPRGPARSSNAQPQERVLHVWQDGFSIDDGELRRFDDPANQTDLQLIRSGRAPLHLMNVEADQPVDVKLHQHETPYVAPPKSYKPFSSSGQRLGSPVPGDGNPPPATSSTSAPAAGSSAGSSAAPTVDASQPTIMLRIQMPDGSRLPARFNTSHTIGDVYGFVQSSSVETRTRSWVLVTTFPNKEHTDKSLVLADMQEFKKGGTAVVKWV